MNKLYHHADATNLSTQIKRVIGYRILICFLLALSVFLTITVIEITSSSHQLEKNIEEQCNTLKSFVISQALVNNEDAIQLKLNALNEQSSNTKFTWNNVSDPTQKHLRWHFPLSWLYFYPVKNMDGTKLGTLLVTGSLLEDHALLSDLLKKISLLLLFFSIIFIVLYPLGKRIPQQLFLEPINNLLLLLRNEKSRLITDSLPNMSEEINEIKNKITDLLKDAEERSHETALGQIARQVAHDIRSPLLVLNLETVGLFSISEKKRLAIRDAIQRVNDIANNLLSQYKKEKSTAASASFLSSEPIAIVLESIISEKRVEASHSSIKIELEICPDANILFTKIDIAEFKRVLSNIINNSIEAITNDGLITIKLSKNVEKVAISIIDKGCGIPKDQLPLILEPGVSFGKTEGSGLGLPYIVNKIYSWNGNYTITSEVNEGTTFEIILPQSKPANWFAHDINIPQNWNLVMLDDDESIHNILNQRFSDEFVKTNNLTIFHFYTPKELVAYCDDSQKISKTIFLLDYELAEYTKNGLALAEMLSITNHATLITSRYEDSDIRDNCQRLKMKMMPKPFFIAAPIKILKNVDLIFIDDDESITEIWKDRAQSVGKNIEVFNNIHDFMRIFDLYEKNTLIYIDSALGGDLKGEDFAKILYDNCYQNIFIATGYNKEDFSKNMYWIKDIVDKYPTF